MKQVSVAVAAVLVTSAAAAAFGIKAGERGVGFEHERITRAALGELERATLSQLVAAVNSPDKASASDNAAHCDGGDYLPPYEGEAYAQTKEAAAAALGACRALIVRELDEAVVAAAALGETSGVDLGLGCNFEDGEGGAKCLVLSHLGRALHTAQDFYAHTNWVDKTGPGDEAPGLGQSGRAAWLDPRQETALPDGLMSGCVPQIDFADVTLGCEYGPWAPFGAHRVMKADLSKDFGPIGQRRGGVGTTARGAAYGNFARAVEAAIDDTADKWSYFKERVRKKYGETKGGFILCTLMRDNINAAACSAEGVQAALCATRNGALDAGAPASAVEIAAAERLWPELREACRMEEADLTRSNVMTGTSSEAARANAKEGAVKMLAYWSACPAQARAQLDARASGQASAKPPLAQIHADCIMAARLQQLGK